MGIIKLPVSAIDFFKENLDGIFESGNLAEGEWNKKLSKYVRDLTGSSFALPTNSNGSGIVALLTIYRHYKGRDSVLMQSNTMYGVKTMVFSGGCKLNGFINCRLETLMPSIQDVKASVNGLIQDEKDKSIILLSHIGGIVNPDIKEIAQFCKKENIVLIEDCAHSFGATLNGEHSGLFGDAGVYSFYATKAIPVGEGGIVVTNNNEIGNLIQKFSIYDRFEQKIEVGSNIRISEVQALLTFSVVREYKRIIDNKKAVAEKYIKVCNELGIKYISQNENGQQGNYYKFIIYTPDSETLEEFKGLTTTSAVYDYDIGTPNLVAKHHACLPIWYNQEMNVVDKVIEELTDSSNI